LWKSSPSAKQIKAAWEAAFTSRYRYEIFQMKTEIK
jgi:hypothetical protein